MSNTYLASIQNVHAIGKPRVFRSPEHFDYLVSQYVKRCIEHDYPLTMIGLELHLGFLSSSDFHNFPKQRGEEFTPCIVRARRIVEDYLVYRATNDTNPAGKRFLLESLFGYNASDTEKNRKTDINIYLNGKDAEL